MTLRSASIAGRILSALGVLIILVELGLYWLAPYLLDTPHPIGAAAVAIGCLFGFIGFYLLDHKGAIEGGGFVVASGVRILDAIPRPAFLKPGGRRSSDPPIVTPTAADPVVTEEKTDV